MKRSDFVRWLALAALVTTPLRAAAAPDAAAGIIDRAVVKLIIEDPSLARYLESRVPLLVSDHLLASGMTPSRFGKPVRILSDDELEAQPHLRFTSFEVSGDVANATVEYAAEHVRATFVLRHSSSGWWTVVKSQVAPSR
ncbi:MAG TPA: hypothetical protein VH417_03020 [Vicinamibacterales bacterium]|jgi:hypothetical protein